MIWNIALPLFASIDKISGGDNQYRRAMSSPVDAKKTNPDILNERVPLRFTRNTPPRTALKSIENEAKKSNQIHCRNQIRTYFAQKRTRQVV
jgi:hypothetical protein